MANTPRTGRVLADLSQVEDNDFSLGDVANVVFSGEETVDTSPKTVVPVAYKAKYRAEAARLGLHGKAHKRSNCDWLAQELANECVRKGVFDLRRFLDICEANGVDAMARWPNRNNGWEGRLRMSGAIVLRGIVGKSGVFRTPESEVRLAELASQGDSLAAAFLAKHDGRNGQ